MLTSLCFIWDGPLTRWYHFPYSILLMLVFAAFVIGLCNLANAIRVKKEGQSSTKPNWPSISLLLLSICAGAGVISIAIQEIHEAIGSSSFQPPLHIYDGDVLLEMAGAIVFPLVVIAVCAFPVFSGCLSKAKTNARA